MESLVPCRSYVDVLFVSVVFYRPFRFEKFLGSIRTGIIHDHYLAGLLEKKVLADRFQ